MSAISRLTSPLRKAIEFPQLLRKAVPFLPAQPEKDAPASQSAKAEKIFGRWLQMERYRNGIQPRPNNPMATYSELELQYRPNSPLASFSVPAFTLTNGDSRIHKGLFLSQAIAKKYLQKDGVLLPVHPQTCDARTIPHIEEVTAGEKTEIEVSPTASSRTVFVLDPTLPPHCLKLHFPFQITRSKRSLDQRTIQHSIAVSDSLASSDVFKTNPAIGFLLETLGISFKEGDSSWGALVREMTPYPRMQSDAALLPLFSLYAPNTQDPGEPPLLESLIEESGENPAEFILERIFYPLLKGWADVFLETGVLLEAHGQNTCIEYDPATGLGRIIFRDFDTYVNQEMREKRGLPAKDLMMFRNEDTDTKPQGSVFSLLYDQAMRVPFDSIAAAAEKKYGIPKAFLQEKCRLYLRQIFPEGDLYFPKDGKVYNYKEGVLEPGVKTRVVATGTPPQWR